MEEQVIADTPRVYQIGTVSTLTGLDAHTIRAWERRYGAVTPERSPGGTRRYSAQDVARLRLRRFLSHRAAVVKDGRTLDELVLLKDVAIRS